MTLRDRPAYPGDRLNWRRRYPITEPASTNASGFDLTIVEPAPPIDRADLDQQAIDLETRAGIRKALDYLGNRTTSPTYRRTRAHLAVLRSVELQARIAGLGHIHVGTTPCGQMCEPMGTHRATPWRDR